MKIDGWRYYNSAAVPTTPPNVDPCTEAVTSGEIWELDGNPILARWTSCFDCKVETRAKRRLGDYEKLGDKTSLQKVIDDLKDRDYRDTHREISPLVMCENAYLLDTTLNNVEECVALMLGEMHRRGLISREFIQERGIELY